MDLNILFSVNAKCLEVKVLQVTDWGVSRDSTVIILK